MPVEARAQIEIKLKNANIGKFLPLKIDPGKKMKPKSKMQMFTKDDHMSDLEQTQRESSLNKSVRMNS